MLCKQRKKETSQPEMCQIFFVKTSEGAVKPKKAYVGSAGYDVFAAEEAIIPPNEVVLVDLGLKMLSISHGWHLRINSRSGLASKENIEVAGAPTIIDSDFTGNIKVPLRNLNKDKSYKIERNDRIAQMTAEHSYHINFYEMKEESEEEELTARGSNAFGSSGK